MSKLVVRTSGQRFSYSSSCAKSWVVLFPGTKTNGGSVTNWVGFELLLKEHSLGLTERRAAWVVKWARETADAIVIHVRSFEEALGRMVFATSALELLRPSCAALRFCHFWTQRLGQTRASIRLFLLEILSQICRYAGVR